MLLFLMSNVLPVCREKDVTRNRYAIKLSIMAHYSTSGVGLVCDIGVPNNFLISEPFVYLHCI